MVLLSINSPNLSSPSSSLSSFAPSPLPSSSSSQDSHDDPAKPPLFPPPFSQINPEAKRRVIIIHVHQRKPEGDRKEGEPKSTPQIKGSDAVVKERGGVSCSDAGDNKERGGKEGKKKRDGSSSSKKPKPKTDTEPEVGFKNPLFSHELKSSRLKAKAAAAQETEKKPKLFIALSKEEIKADFFAFTQSKNMPKKRKRPNHKEIGRLFPGSTLSEITPDTYRVKGFPGSSK